MPVDSSVPFFYFIGVWYCFSFFLEFSFGDKIDRILLNVTYVTSMVSLWLSILLVVLSFSQNSFSLLFIAWFLCGVLCLICSNIYHHFFHLIQEQWMIFFSFIVLGSLALLIWALVDLWNSKAPQNTKLLWTLLVVLVNPIGAILWFTVGKKSNK